VTVVRAWTDELAAVVCRCRRRPASTVGIVVVDLIWALIAAVMLGLIGMMIKKPCIAVATWTPGLIRRARLRRTLSGREDKPGHWA
jgi:uncharacterized membrane protein